VEHAENLLHTLHDKGHIIADRSHRLRIIREKGDDSARTAGGKVIWSQGLLQQVADLVEWPTPMLGRFDPSFLELPKEVLLTSMEVHQKSFGLEGDDGNLLPAFLTVANIEPKNFEIVRHGWEKVLRARLEDAEFFWQADNKSGFDHWLKALENVVFLGPLGSMGDKSRRLERLAALVAKEINPEMEKDMARAGRLAKADLVTQMVGEFDDLQGIMGGIYARRMNEPENVAQALYEQYLPAGQDTPVPSSMAGAVLALCDRADNLTGCFGLGMAPTGAADPYALRRQALGLCRILLEHDLNLDLNRLLKTALAGFVNVQWKLNPATIVPTVMDFIGQRLKSLWSAQGMDSRLLEACIRSGLGDLPDLRARIAALEEFSQAPDFEEAVLTFKRADNIIRKQGEASGAVLSGRFSRDLLTEKAEEQLAAALEEMEKSWNQTMSSKGYAGLFQLLRDLRPVVDDFFDQVMVMCEDEKLRENRLNLLQALVERLSGLADFSALQI
jgi:glycyl-tRNA synthetase beta chain